MIPSTMGAHPKIKLEIPFASASFSLRTVAIALSPAASNCSYGISLILSIVALVSPKAFTVSAPIRRESSATIVRSIEPLCTIAL